LVNCILLAKESILVDHMWGNNQKHQDHAMTAPPIDIHNITAHTFWVQSGLLSLIFNLLAAQNEKKLQLIWHGGETINQCAKTVSLPLPHFLEARWIDNFYAEPTKPRLHIAQEKKQSTKATRLHHDGTCHQHSQQCHTQLLEARWIVVGNCYFY